MSFNINCTHLLLSKSILYKNILLNMLLLTFQLIGTENRSIQRLKVLQIVGKKVKYFIESKSLEVYNEVYWGIRAKFL